MPPIDRELHAGVETAIEATAHVLKELDWIRQWGTPGCNCRGGKHCAHHAQIANWLSEARRSLGLADDKLVTETTPDELE